MASDNQGEGMWMFGDVWSSPDECRRLAELIQQGLKSNLAVEAQRMYLTEQADGSYTACVQTLALIGLRGHLGTVIIDLKNYNSDKTAAISQFTGIGQELLKRTTRWYSQGLTAQEIVDKLLTLS